MGTESCDRKFIAESLKLVLDFCNIIHIHIYKSLRILNVEDLPQEGVNLRLEQMMSDSRCKYVDASTNGGLKDVHILHLPNIQ